MSLTARVLRLASVALLLATSACTLPFISGRERPSSTLIDAERPVLTSRVAALEASGARGDAALELARLRARLEQGDFQVGDQLVFTVQRRELSVDTATVRDGRVVTFAGLPDLALEGVLYSELQSTAQAHVDRFLRDATVRTNALMRLAVLGGISRPGFYNVSRDRPISEVLMVAGGPNASTRLDRIEVKRGGKTIIGFRVWSEAANAGRTFAQMGIEPGDEVHIGARTSRNWQNILQLTFFAVTAFTAIFQLLQWYYAEE